MSAIVRLASVEPALSCIRAPTARSHRSEPKDHSTCMFGREDRAANCVFTSARRADQPFAGKLTTRLTTSASQSAASLIRISQHPPFRVGRSRWPSGCCFQQPYRSILSNGPCRRSIEPSRRIAGPFTLFQPVRLLTQDAFRATVLAIDIAGKANIVGRRRKRYLRS
jgi:hypothetical protein